LQTTPFYVRHLDRAGVRRLLAVIASSPGFRHEMRDALAAYEETEARTAVCSAQVDAKRGHMTGSGADRSVLEGPAHPGFGARW
jgi:hypothetical protein